MDGPSGDEGVQGAFNGEAGLEHMRENHGELCGLWMGGARVGD